MESLRTIDALWVALVIGLSMILVGCDNRPPIVMPAPDFDDDDAPRERIAGIELPRMPTDVERDDVELEEGFLRTRIAILMPTLAPPEGETVELETWADAELADWMRRRAEAVGQAQSALEPARAGRPEYSVVASALLGLAYSRFALDLRGIPTPAAFRETPSHAERFRDALDNAAQPLWQRALDAYGSCSSVAGGRPAHSLDNWREWCDGEIRSVSAMLFSGDDPGDDSDDDDYD